MCKVWKAAAAETYKDCHYSVAVWCVFVLKMRRFESNQLSHFHVRLTDFTGLSPRTKLKFKWCCFFFLSLYRFIPMFKTGTHWEKHYITDSKRTPSPRAFLPFQTISFCVYYILDPEALRGEDKEDLLCSIQCRP